MADASSDRPGRVAGGAAGDGIGPGTVVLVVGPSGAGKDALLQGAAAQLAADPACHFPRRLINRSAHAAEHHDVLSDHQLAGLGCSPTYALSWQAHGLSYAISAEIDDVVRGGGCVVFNASRTVIAVARARYRNLRVVYIDAPRAVRAHRLSSRGRETAAEIRARLARDVATFQPSAADVVIDNAGTLDDGIAALAAALRLYAGTG